MRIAYGARGHGFTIAPMSDIVTPAQAAHLRHRAALVSVIIGILLLGVKWTAYLMTGSLALLSDAFESVVHVGATGIMFWCLRIAKAPPDDDHPYGHGRAEPLSVGFEGGMVALAGLAVLYQAGASFWRTPDIQHATIGLWLSGLAAVVNLGLGSWLVSVGRRTRSKILVADGKHVLSDVYTSGGALIGLGLVYMTGLMWIDAATAAILSIFVLVSGLNLVREAVSGLMDAADPKALEKVVAVLNDIHEPEWLDCHNLRLRQHGDHVYIDFHLVVPSQWTVVKAHSISELIETSLLAALGQQGEVFVHLDHPEQAEYAGLARRGGTWPLTVASATRMEGELYQPAG